jgi:hypothetical protein
VSAKKEKLIAKAQASVRSPKPARLQDGRGDKPGYRVVAVSLYQPEADWVDLVTKQLQLAGLAKANRSLVVREAILRLQEELRRESPAGILVNFTARQAKRAQESL